MFLGQVHVQISRGYPNVHARSRPTGALQVPLVDLAPDVASR